MNTDHKNVTNLKMKWALGVLVFALSGVAGDRARAQTGTPLERRAREVCSQFRQTPGDYEKLFAAGFLAQIPSTRLTAIFADYFSKLGRCTQTKLISPEGAQGGRFELTFEKGYSVPATLAVDANDPYLLNSLLLGAPVRLSATLDEVIAELKTLPGETSLLVASLSTDGIAPIAQYNSERELALGSAFKLYVLGELVREVNAGERKWADVVALDPRFASLPSGMLQSWPSGAPITMHTLASMMISISDNTAADELLMTLGRERVEAILAAAGHSKPELNMPFLSTLEMFKLKGEPSGKNAAAYLALDVSGRRAFLADTIAKIKREDTKPFAGGKPAYVDRIEWFGSAADMCRAMNWLRQQTETDKTARQILAINPGSGLTIPRDRWQYVGYKGGSEPGVLNMTYLLQSTKGAWYSVSIGWNNPQAPLQNEKLFALVQRILQLI